MAEKLKNIHQNNILLKNSIHNPLNKKSELQRNIAVLFILSLFWIIFRSGTKPTRIFYPCQQTALDTIQQSITLFIDNSFIFVWTFLQIFSFKNRKYFILVLIFFSSIVSINILLSNYNSSLNNRFSSTQEVNLILEPQNATVFPASDIFAVNGNNSTNISNLIKLMGNKSLYFYQSLSNGKTHNPDGLIAADDVVIIKINSQWNGRGGTNTDVIKELIQAIIDHPDGFTGEIIVADNGQLRGNFDEYSNNAEDNRQSAEDVVGYFNSSYDVSVYDWQLILGDEVSEFSEGDLNDGYVLNSTQDTETGLYVSYPKFTTQYGTKVSFKKGIWNGSIYQNSLKVINLPVLKTHSQFGVTAAVKHYMGVLSEKDYNSVGGLSSGHNTIDEGSMGTLMNEVGLPTLNIIDAIWVNANPEGQTGCGPYTSYQAATRIDVLLSSTDPFALDFWTAKYVLKETAKQIGYTEAETYSIDPHNTNSAGLSGVFGIWLNKSRDELIRGGYQVTTDENQMNVYVDQIERIPQSSESSSIPSEGTSTNFSFSILFIPFFVLIVGLQRKTKK